MRTARDTRAPVERLSLPKYNENFYSVSNITPSSNMETRRIINENIGVDT